MHEPRADILGVLYSPVNHSRVVERIQSWIKTQTKAYVCVSPAHSVMDCVQDPRLYPLFNSSGMTVPDGMSVAWLLRLKGFREVERVAGTELMREILGISVARGWKHFLYGGTPSVAAAMPAILREQFPGVQIAGSFSPPFRELTQEEDQEIISLINQSGADIVWVGISSPRQEIWMNRHLGRLSVPVMIGVGAAFDFLSGSKLRAPRWMQQAGLEWLFRLYMEPVRMWPRYRFYPKFVLLVLAQWLGWWSPQVPPGKDATG